MISLELLGLYSYVEPDIYIIKWVKTKIQRKLSQDVRDTVRVFISFNFDHFIDPKNHLKKLNIGEYIIKGLNKSLIKIVFGCIQPASGYLLALRKLCFEYSCF